MPKHYGFIVDSRLDDIAARYRRLKANGPNALPPEPDPAQLRRQAVKILAEMDSRGVWLEPGWVRNRRGRKVRPQAGIVTSETFINNVQTLCAYLRAAK